MVNLFPCIQYYNIRIFLELPRVFNKILSYMNKKLERSDGSIIEYLIQAKLWQEKIKPKFPDKFLLPIGCYYNIFTAQIVYAQNKYFENSELFRTLHELQYLETKGNTAIIDGTKTQVHFAFAVLLGDNEGVHNVLGFTTSFNANYYIS
ncbi:hypothetical protein ALC56_09492 [Trachymyrmex septentrionalis]|uniref:Uncharacterized protein n=1 Tax=Trachymyrmex septentrionalis TaxID=34720 RepID=A0A151JUB9_9HYME|nr:hypothetical protein ALC56_09492 [Trachymyrmex septentrionalis]